MRMSPGTDMPSECCRVIENLPLSETNPTPDQAPCLLQERAVARPAATCSLVLRHRPGQAGVEVPGMSLSYAAAHPEVISGCGSLMVCALPGIAARRGS